MALLSTVFRWPGQFSRLPEGSSWQESQCSRRARGYVLVLDQIAAKRLVIRHIALDPLNIRAKRAQRLIGLGCGRAELFLLECANLGNLQKDRAQAQVNATAHPSVFFAISVRLHLLTLGL